MKKLILVLCMTLPAVSFANDRQDASAGITASVTMSPVLTVSPFTATTQNAQRKVILAAREDATLFVANNGEGRTVRLQQALNTIRESNPTLRASDMELAAAIATAQ